ncbi:MAG: hypothetical protein GX260_08620 [Tissierellia bacterium]|nr:hypothetical protein [Tissierellia bacterium]
MSNRFAVTFRKSIRLIRNTALATAMKIVGTDALLDLLHDKKRMYNLCQMVQ